MIIKQPQIKRFQLYKADKAVLNPEFSGHEAECPTAYPKALSHIKATRDPSPNRYGPQGSCDPRSIYLLSLSDTSEIYWF